MSAVYKSTVTRSNLNDVFFLENMFNYGPLTPFAEFPTGSGFAVPGVIGFLDYRYEPAISWVDLVNQKHLLRPDLLAQLNSIDIELVLSNPTVYGVGPSWNPLTLSWSFLTTFDTRENALCGIDKIHEHCPTIMDNINHVGNLVTYEELLIDGVPDPTFVKRFV